MDGLNHSIIKRALEKKQITITCVNIRDFSGNKHLKVDDYPYGGGAGLVMMAAPIYYAYKSIEQKIAPGTKVYYLSPGGRVFNQQKAYELSSATDVVFLCGHYEGVDQRVLDELGVEEISIGDYVLTGGELAAMVIIDATTRLLDGVLGKKESFMYESFTNNLLEHPHYTRPEIFLDKKVPEVLLSGHHANIEKWRKEKSVAKTKIVRPELLELFWN